MTSSVTVTSIAATSEVGGALWLIMTLTLVVLLIGKEIVVGSPGENHARWNIALLVGIVPFTFLFGLIVAVQIGDAIHR